VTLPNNCGESDSSSALKFGKDYPKSPLKRNKNSELNLHLNYIGYTFTDINKDNSPEIKRLINANIKNKTDLNTNKSSANNFCEGEKKVIKTSFIDYNSDLRSSHSSFGGRLDNNRHFHIKNQITYDKDKSKESPIDHMSIPNLDILSNYKKDIYTNQQIMKIKNSLGNIKYTDLKTRKNSIDSFNKKSDKDNFIMEKNIINNEANFDIKQNLEKYLNNEINLDSINMEELKKFIKSKAKTAELKNKINNENHNNKEEIKSILKEISEKDDKNSEKYRKNNINKENDAFYTKLSDYRSKIFSERDSRNLDEKYSLKNKINSNNNRFYATNNTYENNLVTSNELLYRDCSKIKYYKPQNKKNILDKTKRLLNKNSFENFYEPQNHYQNEGKNNFQKLSDINYSNNF
jgi:hypothetical protein